MKTADPGLVTYLGTLMPNGGFAQHAELFSFGLTNGASFNCTTWDRDIVYRGTTYSTFASQGGPFVKRGTIKHAIGTDVQSMDLELYAQPANQINGIPILQAVRQGNFDGASILVTGLWLGVPTGVDGGYYKFLGSVGAIAKVGRSSCQMTCNSGLELLNTQMPRNVFMPSCRHTLYDVNCGVSKAGKTATGTVSAGSNARVLNTSLTPAAVIAPPSSAPSVSSASASTNLGARVYYVVTTYVSNTGETTASPEAMISIPAGQLLHIPSPPAETGAIGWNGYVGLGPGEELLQFGAPLTIGSNYTEPATGITQGVPPPSASSQGYYALGVITFTSGPNSGLSLSIQGNTGGVITTNVPLPNQPHTGDAFSIVPGCNKQFTTCVYLQGSSATALVRFGGQPFVPVPEAAF